MQAPSVIGHPLLGVQEIHLAQEGSFPFGAVSAAALNILTLVFA